MEIGNYHLELGVKGLGLRDITQSMENQMERNNGT